MVTNESYNFFTHFFHCKFQFKIIIFFLILLFFVSLKFFAIPDLLATNALEILLPIILLCFLIQQNSQLYIYTYIHTVEGVMLLPNCASFIHSFRIITNNFCIINKRMYVHPQRFNAEATIIVHTYIHSSSCSIYFSHIFFKAEISTLAFCAILFNIYIYA